MSKTISFFLFLILLGRMSYAQPAASHLLYSDFIQLPGDSSTNVIYTYKIPLDHLVFEKESNLFLAQYRISVEVFNADNEKFITRAIKEKNIQVADYKQTRSPLIFSEGFMKMDMIPGTYSVTEIFFDYKSNRELRLPLQHIKVDSGLNIIPPLITEEKAVECIDRKSQVLTNYGGRLPFDENQYVFIIPVKKPETDSLFVNIIQNNDTLYKSTLINPQQKGISISECGGKLQLDENPGNGELSLYEIHGISGKIAEGTFQINISQNPEYSGQEKFILSCSWINKPLSLRNPEMAISALKFIEKDSVIKSLLRGDEEDYSRNLAAYWKKIDPTPETRFNPLMQEFYTRIDYAAKNFTTIAGANGANTDRGKVYIRFGKPMEINRTSDNYGNIIETWTYNNPQRKFVFVDKKGTGDFSLISG